MRLLINLGAMQLFDNIVKKSLKNLNVSLENINNNFKKNVMYGISKNRKVLSIEEKCF